MTAALAFHDLTLGYDRHPAVHHLDAEIPEGSLTAIIGPNGAGKSTLLKGVIGTLAPLEGQVAFGTVKHDDIAYLPQQSDVDRSFPLSVVDLVAMGLWREIGAFGQLARGHRGRVEDAIAAVGLTGFEDRPIGALSGGQMQRALFARLLLQDARLVLLDEPFTAIDQRTMADLLGVVRRWHGEGRTVLAVLHDFDTVRAHFPRTLMLAREMVAHGPTAQVLTAENQLRARAMAEAPDPDAATSARGARHDLGRRHRPLRRVRLHAPRAAGLHRDLCGRDAGRRVPDAAADEPDRRRHGARHPARRRGGLSRGGPLARGHDHRRHDRGHGGGARSRASSPARRRCARMPASRPST